MKISTFITILLFVGIIFFLVSSMTNEVNDLYGTGIDTTQYTGQYDYSGSVNSSVTDLKSSVESISNEDKGWFEKVGSGFTGIIAAVKLLPSLLGGVFVMGGGLITGFSTALGIPPYILGVILISLTIWGLFKLIEFLQKWPL